MRRCLNFLIVLAIVTIPWAAAAQDIRINPVPPAVKPQWTKVPGVPQVSWAPNLPTDVFRYRGTYYFFWADYLYKGRAPQGPWKVVQQVPQVFYRIDPAYFKTLKKPDATPAAPETPSPGEGLQAPAPNPPELTPPPPRQPESPEAPTPKAM